MTVLDLQTALRTLGYAPGSLDGVSGPKTITALKEFQFVNRLAMTGALDDQTEMALHGRLLAAGEHGAWPKQDRASMNSFYGNPDANGDGVPDRAWEDANIVAISPPYPMVLAWAPDTSLKAIRVHKKCAPSLANVLSRVLAHYGSVEAVKMARMHLFGGCYNYRLMRGANQLSVHSWGAAIDLDPERNAFGRKYGSVPGMMPQAVIDLFAAEGWVSGAHWSTADAQHFQAARL